MKKIFLKPSILLLSLTLIFTNFPIIQSQAETTGEIKEIDKLIKEKKEEIENLKEEIKSYEKKIAVQKEKSLNLTNELAILENRIAKTKLDIKTTEIEIEKTNLEVKEIENQIEEKKKSIKAQKEQISKFIQTLNRYDEKNYLEIFILNKNFSDFFNQIEYLEEIEERLKGLLDTLLLAKEELETKQQKLTDKSLELNDFKIKLEGEKSNLDEKLTTRGIVLVESRQTERGFQNLLWQVREEEIQVDREVVSLEKKLREALEKAELENGLTSFSSDLDWPVDPSRGITTYFHDPEYPFRYIFEHPGLDIRVSQGTVIKAPASGYVARAKDAGYGYSYIMLIHNNGISTVYGHVSRIDVAEDTYVTRGQAIGLSGGMPGTPGAGRLTTGPHLHFEVRLNGIPVNPLEYLP